MAVGDTSGLALVTIDASLQIPNEKLGTWDLSRLKRTASLFPSYIYI